MITVASSKGKFISTAIENVRFAVHGKNELTILLKDAIEQCTSKIEDAIDDEGIDGTIEVSNNETDLSHANSLNDIGDNNDIDESRNNQMMKITH